MRKPLKALSMAAVVAITGTMGAVSAPTTAHAATTPSSCQYVFLTPHNDDELLTMGAGIRQHVNALGGAKVCVVMMTTGVTSGVQDALKNPSNNPDGKAYNLTDAQFTTARDRESWNALLYMGVPAANIYLNGYTTANTGVPRIVDVNNGSAAQDAAVSNWMGATINYFGARHYKTMTDKSTDTGDHRAMGRALRARVNDPRVLSARFYSEPYRTSSVALIPVPYSATDKTQLQKANNSFRIWSPTTGFYKIGYRSVTDIFNSHYSNPISYQHS